jgi:hypothetical protein
LIDWDTVGLALPERDHAAGRNSSLANLAAYVER